MIKKIGIENFRVFKNYTEFDLAPINILTGPNNSGKSSLIKVLSLIKKSFVDEFGINRLNFEGGNHNLGTFENILNWNNESRQLKLTFDFPLNHFNEKFQIELVYILEEQSENGTLTSIKVFNQKTELFKVFASLKDTDFDIIEEDTDFYGFYSVNLQYLKDFLKLKNKLFFNYYNNSNGKKELINKKYKALFLAFEDVFSSLIFNFDPDDDDYMRFDILTDYLESILKIEYKNLSNFFKKINLKTDGKNINVWDMVVNSYLKLNDLNRESISQSKLNEMKHFLEELEDIILEIDNDLQDKVDMLIKNNFEQTLKKLLYTIESIDHLTALRGNQKRGLSDPDGNNIDAIVKEYYTRNYPTSFLSKCFEVLGINGQLVIERKEGVISFVYLKNGNKKTLLSDLGFGYSQLIPIILKINLIGKMKDEEWHWKNPYKLEDLPEREPMNSDKEKDKDLEKNNLKDEIELIVDKHINILFPQQHDIQRLMEITKYSILIIEEPEANLHPNLQSKLADIFVLAQQEFNIKFVIETHSEYLIRKLQYLTANKAISTDDVNIYYFNDDQYVNEKEKKVKKININEFGGLTDSFGPGFFDEATHLQFELLKLNKGQNN